MGGGAGQYLADWLVRGRPPYPLPAVDPARFSATLDRAACLAHIRETYAAGYSLPGTFSEALAP